MIVVGTGDIPCTLASLVSVTNVPECAAPGDQELGVTVTNPGVSPPDQGVGDGVAPQLVEVDHPHTVVPLSGQVESATTWAVA